MKLKFLLTLAACIGLPAMNAAAQSSGGPWRISSFTIDGGGRQSTGGPWTLTGTIGQADATASKSTGGTFAVQGGFWPGASVVATPGGPVLSIAPGSAFGVPNTARLSYDATASGYQLQFSSTLSGWADFGSPITGAGSIYFGLNNGPKYFFRLKKL